MTTPLRWLLKDGEKTLQQWVPTGKYETYITDEGWAVEVPKHEWVDVPVETEDMRASRK